MATFSNGYAESLNRRIISPLDIDNPDLAHTLDMRYPRWNTLSLLKKLGRMKNRGAVAERTTTQHKFEYYEETNWYNPTCTLTKVTSYGGGTVSNGAATVYVQIASDDHTRGGKGSYPKKHMTVQLSSGVYAYVAGVDRSTDGSHKFQLVRTNGSDDLDASITSGTTKGLFYSNAQGEEAGTQETSIPEWVKYTQYLQTFRASFKVTDHEKFVEKWVQKGNTKENVLVVQGIEDTTDRFIAEQESAFLIGKVFTGVDQVNGNGDTVPVQTTEGIIPIAETYGVDLQNNTSSVANFETIIKALRGKYGDRKYLLQCGGDRMDRLNSWVPTFQESTQGAIDFAPVGGKEQAISLNLQYFSMSGFTFYFKEAELFSHPDSYGDSAFGYSDMMLGVPLGETKVKFGNKEENTPMFQIAYVKPPVAPQHDHGDHAIWSHGAMSSPVATSGVMHEIVEMQSYKGLEAHCKHKYLKVYA